jgi:iron complex transport system permease protein
MKAIARYMFLFILLVVLFVLDLILGSTYIPLSKILSVFGDHAGVNETIVVLGFRLPKAIAAITAGMALSVAGLLMQTFFRNPLAGPYVLGINSLSSLFVAVFILSGGHTASVFFKLGLPFAACLGAFSGLLILLALSAKLRSGTHLLLVGMMIGFLAGALQSVLEYVSNPNDLKNFVLWNMASLSNVLDSDLLIFVLITGSICFLCFFLVKPLNLLLLGEEQAQLLGVNARRLKVIILILVAILSGITTAYCGPIGFVGIAMPHLVRILFKTTHHLYQLIGCILLGACFMLFCDIVSNLPFFEITLPVNVITSLLGAPFVLWLIFRNRNNFL